MESSSVKVVLSDGHEVTLLTDNPNIDQLVKEIVSIRDQLDIANITVTCESKEFDADGFTEVIKESAREFLDAIVLEKKMYESVIEELTA